jgi:hypothetical protein
MREREREREVSFVYGLMGKERRKQLDGFFFEVV